MTRVLINLVDWCFKFIANNNPKSSFSIYVTIYYLFITELHRLSMNISLESYNLDFNIGSLIY
jgi:hypothetical protein